MKTILTLVLFFSLSTFAQTPLKLSTKPDEKPKMCRFGGKPFPIRNADDQAVCDQLKKSNPRGSAVPPHEPIATPNPITEPPTGN